MMETYSILAAVAAIAIFGAVVLAISARARRPELRTKQEEDLDATLEDALMFDLKSQEPSPIDRSAPILEAEVVTPRRLPPPRGPAPEEAR